MVLHMIGNAHLDPAWFWQWTEGYHEAKATFRSALDRMNEYPDFVFTCSAAAYYEWIEQDEPEMFAEIRRRVQEGRWAIVGGWWIQPDCNAPCGESFARQGLIAQRYFQSRFGMRAHTAYNVDSFGHNGMLPQIFRLSGMENYVFMRPMKHEKSLPANIFLWESADGRRVKAFRIPIAYCTWEPELRERMEECLREMPPEAPAAMGFYGVGNHGGGPTKENIESILRWKDEMQMEFSSPDRFFANVSAEGLPVVRGELFHHASGCYSVHSGVKKWNRQAENALLAAEKWCAIAAKVLGRAYPADDLRRAWKCVLFNQFHDILSGTCAPEAYEDARNQYGEALSIAQRAANSAMQALAWRIRIPQEEGARPIVVFNPHAFAAKLAVELQSADAPGCALFDSEGREIPWQRAQGSAASNGRIAALFEAEVPALGYRLFTLRPSRAEAHAQVPSQSLVLENECLRAEFSPESGLLTSLYDKRSGEALAAPSLCPVAICDTSDTWSHAVTRFDEELGRFRLIRIARTEDGPVRSSIRAEFAWRNSSIVMTYSLWRTADQLSVLCEVNWQERETMLKWEMQCAGDTSGSTAEIPFGFAKRPSDGVEYPMQSWVRLGNLTVINDGKFAYDALDSRLRITLLRSPRYAHHTPKVCTPEEHYPFIDQGWQTVRFALCPAALSPMEASRRGMLLNQPYFALHETFHPEGALPTSASFAETSGALLTALKCAEDGSGERIVHLYEAKGESAIASGNILGHPFRLSLAPHEIAALRFSESGACQRVDLLEESLE